MINYAYRIFHPARGISYWAVRQAPCNIRN